MEKFQAWVQQLDFTQLWEMLIVVAASLLCITFHETCHGLVAYWMGDPTAKKQGRLSLNPLRHIDIMGLVMMAVCHFGWAKPVPVDMRNFRRPKAGMALTALAGPGSNVLLAYVAVLFASASAAVYICSGSKVVYYLWLFFFYLEIMSAGLAVFNLFPIPPLDGSHALNLAVSALFGPLVGDAVAALAGVLCSLALLGGAVYLYVQTRGGALVIFAALALLLSALKELRLARRAIKV